MKRVMSTIKFIIGWPLAVVALFFVIKLFIGSGNILVTLGRANIILLSLSIILYLFFFFIRVLFWQKLLQTKGIHFSYKQTALFWGLSEFKRYIPGSIWPILSRSNAYAKLGSKKAVIFANIFQEAEFLGVSCMLLSLLSLNFFLFGILHIKTNPFLSSILVLFFCGVIIAFLFHKNISALKKIPLAKHLLPDLSFSQMFSLFSLMITAFFFYGLATYFAISSLTPLYVSHVLSLTGFFVLAFLTGYLSFFAPMGLGVREGFMTIGLTRYIPITAAALGAIFSRIIQILAELIFLGICIVWSSLEGKFIRKLELLCLKYKYEIATVALSLSYTAYFTLATFLRYINFFTGRFDLGNMDQTVWNTIHGRIFQLTDPNGTNIISRLAFHADFMLILLAPFYLIWQDPRMLLLIQSFAIGIGAFFIFLIGRNVLKSNALGFAFALSYVLYPALEYANLFDFHAVTIAVPLFLASWYAILKKRFFIAVILLFLAATVKEEVWFIVGLFGLYLAFRHKKYVLGTILCALSFGMFYYLFWHAIPSALGSNHFALSYYSDFGSTPGGVIKNIFLSPVKTLRYVFGPRQLLFLFQLFAPLGFFSLFYPFVLLFAAPDLAISVLSQNAQLHEIYYHYGALPAPFIFIAGVYGVRFLRRRFSHFSQKFIIAIILFSAFLFAYAFGPLPGAFGSNTAMFTQQLPYAGLIDNFLRSIPKKYSVAATNNVGSHLSHRQKIFTIPVGLKQADVVVFLLNDSYAQPSLADQKRMARELNEDSAYVKLFAYKDFVVYKKKNVPTYNRIKPNGFFPIFKGN